MSVKEIKVLLLGFGSVNQKLCELFIEKSTQLANTGLSFNVVAVSDSKGGVYCSQGIDIAELLKCKEQLGSVTKLTNVDILFESSEEMVHCLNEYDILVDGSPVNLIDGSPGLQCCLCALSNGKGAVLANKAPLVLGWQQLFSQLKDARNWRDQLGYSATVCGGLPVVDSLSTELLGGLYSSQSNDFRRVRGILNSTSSMILSLMTQGLSFDQSLKQAQNEGIAEADPTLDLDGSDAANKLFIIVRTLGGQVRSFDDIQREGIEKVTPEMLAQAEADGQIVRLVATAVRNGDYSTDDWTLTVKPECLDKQSLLGQCNGPALAVEVESDLFGSVFMMSDEKDGVVPTSSAVLRDLIYVGKHLLKRDTVLRAKL